MAKKTREKTDKRSTISEKKASLPPQDRPRPPWLTQDQLHTLILLLFAISRIVQIGAAAGSQEECSKHLGLEPCQDPRLQTLVTKKYESALHVLAIALACLLPIWKYPVLLQRLHMVFLVSPILLVVVALFLTKGLVQSTKTQNILLCSVLVLVIFPYQNYRNHNLPKHKQKTLQSLTLFVFMALSFMQAMEQAKTLLQPQPAQFFDPTTETINVFLLIDKMTLVTIYGFAWYYYTMEMQRMTLMGMMMLHAMEYYSYSRDDQHEQQQADSLQALTMTFFCGLASVAPEIKWKKKL